MGKLNKLEEAKFEAHSEVRRQNLLDYSKPDLMAPATRLDIGDNTEALPWFTGVETIDQCLPDQGIDRCGVHEIEPLRSNEMVSLTGFAFALLSRLRSSQPIIWCVTEQQVGEYGQLYAFGLERYGISPALIVFVRVQKAIDLHFALEEALKTKSAAAVIGEGAPPDFTGSRRLSLLARAHKTPCLLLNPNAGSGHGSAALTRWQISPVPSVEDPRDPLGPGLPSWLVALPRSRGGKAMPPMDAAHRQKYPTAQEYSTYPWRVIWNDETHSFCSFSVFLNGKASEKIEPYAAAHRALVG